MATVKDTKRTALKTIKILKKFQKQKSTSIILTMSFPIKEFDKIKLFKLMREREIYISNLSKREIIR